MRIISRTEFLAQPVGTLFCKWPTGGIVHMSIKKESWQQDYLELDFNFPAVIVNGKAIMPTEEEDVPENVPFSLDYPMQRDGLFDFDQQFCIYEEADVRQLLALLQKHLRFAGEAAEREL